jgi:hypothetical protein
MTETRVMHWLACAEREQLTQYRTTQQSYISYISARIGFKASTKERKIKESTSQGEMTVTRVMHSLAFAVREQLP